MNILLFSVHNSTFVKKDFEILKEKHDVSYYPYSNPQFHLVSLYKNIKNCELIYCWFASLNFFLPVLIAKLLEKKIIIVAGGYDVAKVESIKYGSQSSTFRGFIVNKMFSLSDKIIAVSKSNQQEAITNCRVSREKIELIYHGFKDLDYYCPLDNKKDELITIGLINKASFYRKGIDRFIKLAEVMPEYKFHLVGLYDEYLNQQHIPSNVILHGFVDKQKLEELLCRSKIYLQLSRHEGFGCSVAEAMQYGCIPVVSNSYALPEVVGETGKVVNDPDNTEQLKHIITETINSFNYNTSINNINRVKDNFNLGQRKKQMLEMVDSL